MKNIQRIIVIFITITLLSCNSKTEKKKSVENSNTEFQKYEIVFLDIKEHLEKENGKLWNYQLFGPILLVDEKNQIIIANEPDSNKVLSKKGEIYTGSLPKEMLVAETTINWNGKLWAMVPLPLPKNHNEQLSILTHELYHRIQSKVGLSILQQKKCDHLDKLDGRIYLKLELEALKMALRTNDENNEIRHIKNALLFRAYRHQLFPNAKENENSMELNEGIAEYTGTILSNWDDEGLRNHYIQAIDTLYENKTFVWSFAYRTTPIYGYYINKKNKDWNKEINNETDLTEYINKQFNIQVPINLKDTIKKNKEEYYYQEIYDFETERERKQKELLVKLEIKYQSNPTLILPLISMNISFSPGDITPFKNIGTVYQNIRITDKWGSLSAKEAIVGRMWKKTVVSEPTEISDTIIKGKGWEIELNQDWRLEKIDNNYTLKKK